MKKEKLPGVLLLLLCLPGAGAVLADASAFASGSDGASGWATRASQREANLAALDFCNRQTARRDCLVDTTKAIVRAENHVQAAFSRSSAGLPDARQRSLANCGAANCRVTLAVTQAGFYALARSEPDHAGDRRSFLTYGFSDLQEASHQALRHCETAAERPCSIVWNGAIAGLQAVPRSEPATGRK